MKKVPQKMFTALCNEGQEEDEYPVSGDTAADALESAEGAAGDDGSFLVAEYKLVRTFRAKLEKHVVRRVVKVKSTT